MPQPQAAPIILPALGQFAAGSGLIPLTGSSDGRFTMGRDGVTAIAATGDRVVEFIGFAQHTLAYVRSAMGWPAYYPIKPVQPRRPVKAVLMDLDGTSVRSESFWIWIIEQTTASLLGDATFRLAEQDFPHVSGHSVSEHLSYCIRKYAPQRTVEEARRFYFQHTHREMAEILAGRGKEGAFTPSPGLKDFLLELKRRGIRIGLVTSGLYEKAFPEILDAFRTLNMGDPKLFYDAIITAGNPLRKGESGTLGELEAKPHPWLYAETLRVGLGIPEDEREHVLGIEDSGAGVCAIRLANLPVVGYAGGNIHESGTRALCHHWAESFADIVSLL